MLLAWVVDIAFYQLTKRIGNQYLLRYNYKEILISLYDLNKVITQPNFRLEQLQIGPLAPKNINNIRIYKRLSAVQDYYHTIHQTLKPKDEVLVVGAQSGNINNKRAKNFFEAYSGERKNLGIFTKILFNQCLPQNDFDYYTHSRLVEGRYLPEGLELPISFDIYNDSISFLDWRGGEPVVVEFRDK